MEGKRGKRRWEWSCFNMQTRLMEGYDQQAERPSRKTEVWENRTLMEWASELSWASGSILAGLTWHWKKITAFLSESSHIFLRPAAFSSTTCSLQKLPASFQSSLFLYGVKAPEKVRCESLDWLLLGGKANGEWSWAGKPAPWMPVLRNYPWNATLSAGTNFIRGTANWGMVWEGGESNKRQTWFNTWWALEKTNKTQQGTGLGALAWHIPHSTYMLPKWIYASVLCVG